MLNKIKAAAKDIFLYGLGNILTKIVGLILLPLYTKALSLAEYGGLGIAEVSSLVLVTVFDLSLYRALERYYWDDAYKNKRESIFFSLFVFLIMTSSLMCFSFWGILDNLSILLFDSESYVYLLQLMLVGSAIQILNELTSSLVRLKRKPILFSIANLVRFTSTLIFTIIFITKFNKKLEGIYEAILIGQVLYFVTLGRFIIQNIQFKFNMTIIKEMLTFSAPLIISSLSVVILSSVDRYILKFIDDFKAVGLYSLGIKVANTVKILVVRSIELAVGPMKFQVMNQPDHKRFYSKLTTYSALIVIFVIIGVSIFSKEVIELLAQDEEYYSAYSLVPILSFSIYFYMLRRSLNIGLLLVKKTRIIALLVISMSIVNIVFNFILINLFGVYGAATATVLTQALFFTFVAYYSQKAYLIPYEFEKIVKIFVIAIILVLGGILLNDVNFIFRVAMKILILILIFPTILYLWHIFDKIEILRLKELVHKFIKR